MSFALAAPAGAEAFQAAAPPTQAPTQAQPTRQAALAMQSDGSSELLISKDKVLFRATGQRIPWDTSEVPFPLETCLTVAADAGETRTLAVQLSKSKGQAFQLLPQTVCRDGLKALTIQDRADVVVYHVIPAPPGGKATYDPVQVLTFATKPPPDLPVLSTREEDNRLIVDVPIDRTGIADWRFLNPRRVHQACVWKDVSKSPPECGSAPDPPSTPTATVPLTRKPVILRFRNRMADRTVVVTFSEIPSARRALFAADGWGVSCKNGLCQAVTQVAENSPREIEVSLLYRAYLSDGIGKGVPPLQFAVSLFDDETALSNPKGAFSLVEAGAMIERSEPLQWSFIGSGDGGIEPDLTGLVPPCPAGTANCSKTPVISVVHPREDFTNGHLAGTVRLGFAQGLGSRAKAEIEIQLKKGDFGGISDTNTVQASKYRLYLFAANGSVLSGGRYTFAAPSRAIAVNETGEGVTMSFRWAELSQLFKKKVAEGTIRSALAGRSPGDPSIPDGDHHTTILQLRDARWLTTPGNHLRLQVLGLYGRQQLNAIWRSYSTTGGEVFFAVPQTHVTGSLATYRSRRTTPAAAPVQEDASGHASLLTVGWTHFGATLTPTNTRQVDFTLSGLVGYGSGDQFSTEQREDYICETASFAPDLIFLSTLASLVAVEPASGGRVGKGLSNKTYTGFNFSSQHFSPLRYIARLLRVQGDTVSEGSTVKWHVYRLNEPVFGQRYAGVEVDAEFRIESPKGIKYSVSAGAFRPGPAVRPVITKLQWTLLGNLSVKM